MSGEATGISSVRMTFGKFRSRRFARSIPDDFDLEFLLSHIQEKRMPAEIIDMPTQRLSGMSSPSISRDARITAMN